MVLSILLSLMLPLAAATETSKDTNPKPTPMMRVVQPAAVKAGSNVTIAGENLGREFIAEVYLSDGTTEQRVDIVAQTDEAIVFKVPANCKAGAYKVLVLLTSIDPMLLEEPVRLTVTK